MWSKVSVGDFVEIAEYIRDQYMVGDLIVGEKRKSLIGNTYQVKRVKVLVGGKKRYILEGVDGVVWSRNMFRRIEREVNEI
jgi:hypothetical protein